MFGNRMLAENRQKERVRLSLSNRLFDFVNDLKVGEKYNMKVLTRLNRERQGDNNVIIKTLKIMDAKLNKKMRIG